MSNGDEYVRDICKSRKIPVSTLEKACGFSNGYLNPKKLSKIPYDRALLIADYLDVDVQNILGVATPPQLSARDERDIAKDLDNIMSKIQSCLLYTSSETGVSAPETGVSSSET